MPREIVHRWQLSWKRRCWGHFGAYCEAFNKLDSTTLNTQEPRSREATVLGPMENFQGTYKFIDLNTGKLFKRRKFTELPMTESGRKKVKKWGYIDKRNGRLTFADCHNRTFDWDSDEYDAPLIEDNTPEPKPSPYPGIPAEMPGIELEGEYENIAPALIEEHTNECEEIRAAWAANNANYGPREEGLSNRIPADIQGVAGQPNITINVIQPDGNEVKAMEEYDMEPPPLATNNDAHSSDKEEYTPDNDNEIDKPQECCTKV